MRRIHGLSIGLGQSSSNPSSRRGIVLLIVMIVVVLVSLAGFGFVAVMFTENKAVRLRGEQLQIEQAMASAELLIGKTFQEQQSKPVSSSEGSAGLTLPEEFGTETGTYDNPTLFQARPLIPGVEDPDPVRFTVITPKRGTESTQSAGTPGELPVRFGVEDESSRLNLATLLIWERQAPGSGQAALLKLPGMSEEIADAILDWLDTDDQPRTQGAESEFYAGLNPAYSSRNGTPESIEELLLIKGVTRELLYGLDQNQNGIIESQEQDSQFDAGVGEFDIATTGWQDFLTLYSRESNRRSDGTPRIDVNASDLSRLYLQLSAIEKRWGEFVVHYRQFGPMAMTTIPAPDAEIVTSRSPAFTQSPQFRISNLLELVDAKVQIPASGGEKAKILTSPFESQSEQFGSQLPRLLSELTTDSRPVLEGRINLNTANPTVLSMIPGLPFEAVERIASAQDRTGGNINQAQRTPAWLLTEGILDRTALQQILPFITCRGDAARAQIIGYSSQSQLAGRAEVVIDVSTPSPRRLYWRDLQIWGRGFPWDILDPSLADETNPGQAIMADMGGSL